MVPSNEERIYNTKNDKIQNTDLDNSKDIIQNQNTNTGSEE
jgi:hypothetical protein